MHIFSHLRTRLSLVAVLTLSFALTLSVVLTISPNLPIFAHGLGRNVKSVSQRERIYGPFASGSPDSSTCGGNWANDTFFRLFIVDPSSPNVFTEAFLHGKFVTLAGPSPNACVILAPPNGNRNTVAAGVTGNFSGSFDVSVTGGTFNPFAFCRPDTCNTTAGFVHTIYGTSAQFNTGATFFEFDYYTQENGSWHNASANRGGNRGDITGSLDTEDQETPNIPGF